jgi:uncharacterized membrane protein
MNNRKNLAAQVAGAIAIAALVGTSAFAESRHSDATERDHGRQSIDRGSRDRAARSGSETQTQERHDTNTTAPQTYQRDQARNNRSWQRENNTRQRDESRNNNGNNSTWQRDQARTNNGTWNRNETRNNGTWNRNESRNNGSFERSQTESYRNNNRSQSYRNNRPQYDNRGRRSEFLEGRISRYEHERGGYRIWVDGGRFPVWIPEARIGLFPHLRVGLSLRFGGYYDPLGYLEAYDYYNDGYGYGGGYGGSAYSSGLLRGVVETVDYRRGTLVLRDDVSGSFVTALIRDRRLESLRPGDYAEISGDWTRAGVFEGLRLEDTRDGRY